MFTLRGFVTVAIVNVLTIITAYMLLKTPETDTVSVIVYSALYGSGGLLMIASRILILVGNAQLIRVPVMMDSIVDLHRKMKGAPTSILLEAGGTHSALVIILTTVLNIIVGVAYPETQFINTAAIVITFSVFVLSRLAKSDTSFTGKVSVLGLLVEIVVAPLPAFALGLTLFQR